MNVFDYDMIQQLMAEYRSSKDLDRIRETWNYVLSLRPLVAREWREWIQDDADDRLNLFKKATEESCDVELWEEYLDFMLNDANDFDLQELHRATAGAGWHFKMGYKIWERVLGSMIQNYVNDNSLEENVRLQFYKRAEMLMDDVSLDSLLVQYSGFETLVAKDYESNMKKFNSLVFKQRKEGKKRDRYEQTLVFFAELKIRVVNWIFLDIWNLRKSRNRRKFFL